jgi:hypothetical protein
MLVDGVVEHLKDAVVQTPLIGIADVHARAFANRLKALQLVDLGSSILLATRGVLLLRDVTVVEGDDRFCRWFLGHGKVLGMPWEAVLWFRRG